MLPQSFPPEAPDLTKIIRPANALAMFGALDPAFSIDYAGMATVVSYTFGNEALLVGHVHRVPGAGSSSLDIVRAFLTFVADVRAKTGATWLPGYSVFDCTKDRSFADRLVEMGVGSASPARGAGAVRFPPLQGILFGGAGSQATVAAPIAVVLPGRGRFSVPVVSVPKVFLYTGLREKLVLQQLKLAATPSTPTLLKELENLEAKISAARNVLIKAGGDEPHDDLADALALAVWAASEYEAAREDARRRSVRVGRLPPSQAAWT